MAGFEVTFNGRFWVTPEAGNVFADFGLKDADQLMARSQIGFYVFKILEEKKLKQREIASILVIAQSDVSHLMNGHFSRFTTDKLLDFLRRLDRKVTIEVSPRHKGEPYQEVTFVPGLRPVALVRSLALSIANGL